MTIDIAGGVRDEGRVLQFRGCEKVPRHAFLRLASSPRFVGATTIVLPIEGKHDITHGSIVIGAFPIGS